MITVNKANPTPGEITSSLTGSTGDGAGLHFDGAAGNISFTPVDLGSKFSHEFVIKAGEDLTTGSSSYIIDYEGGSGRFVIGAEPTQASGNLAIYDDAGWKSFGVNPLTDLKVHHIVVTVDGTAAVLYDNGNQVGTATINANHGIDNATAAAIGSNFFTATSNNFEGVIYRARVYNHTLSADDVRTAFERADVDFSSQYGSQTTINSGTTTTGKRYRITARDGVDFTTVGAADNNVGTEFLATGSVTLDANDTVVQIGAVVDLDLAFASPTQSRTVQDRAGLADGTCSASGVTQVQPVVQGNLTSLAVSSGTARTPADGAIISDTLGVGVAPVNKLSVEGYNTSTTVGTDVDVHIEGGGAANRLTQLGFGYNAQNTSWKPPVIIGSKTGSASGQTEADFFVATRSGTTGTDAPATRLTIDSSGTVSVTNATSTDIGTLSNATQLYLENSTANKPVGITFGASNASGGPSGTGTSSARVSALASGGVGVFDADLVFETRSGSSIAERMRISSTGDVTVNESLAIGTTPTAGVSLNVRENSTTTAADIRNTNASGYGLYIAGGSTSSHYALKVAPYDNSTAFFTVRGDGLATFNNGIAFTQTNTSATGASTVASILDHYEEGTFTLTDASGAGLTISGGLGRYTRIGNTVHITVHFTMPTTSDSSAMKLSGLPFAVPNENDYRGLVLNYSNKTGVEYAITQKNSDDIDFITDTGANSTNADGSGGGFYINGHYKV